eukprot:4698251-Pyramimonas_sp.AAC.1
MADFIGQGERKGRLVSERGQLNAAAFANHGFPHFGSADVCAPTCGPMQGVAAAGGTQLQPASSEQLFTAGTLS